MYSTMNQDTYFSHEYVLFAGYEIDVNDLYKWPLFYAVDRLDE